MYFYHPNDLTIISRQTYLQSVSVSISLWQYASVFDQAVDRGFVQFPHLRIADRRADQHHPVIPIQQKSMELKYMF